MRKCLAVLLSAGVLLAGYTVSVMGPTQVRQRAFAEDHGDGVFDNRSMRGNFVLSMDGSFSSAPPPFTGERENLAMSQVGLFHFDGRGHVAGEYTLAFENELSGGLGFVPFTVVGTYSVAANGRMTIETEDFVGDFKSNEVSYECVIVERRKLARCMVTELVSFNQGPDPIVLPASGLGAFERQK